MVFGVAVTAISVNGDKVYMNEGAMVAGCWPELKGRHECQLLEYTPLHLRRAPTHATTAAGAVVLACVFLALILFVKQLDGTRKDEDRATFEVSPSLLPFRRSVLTLTKHACENGTKP